MNDDADLCDCECRCDDYPTWQHVAMFCGSLAIAAIVGAFVMGVVAGG